MAMADPEAAPVADLEVAPVVDPEDAPVAAPELFEVPSPVQKVTSYLAALTRAGRSAENRGKLPRSRSTSC